jgi:carbon-monoxide dehydrogenase medium subunit
MKPAPFTYQAATSSPEAVGVLAQDAPPRILAGGQSLVPMLNLRLAPADALLDITRIPELRAVTETANTVRYGALTTHAAFEDGLVPDASNRLMRHAARSAAPSRLPIRPPIGSLSQSRSRRSCTSKAPRANGRCRWRNSYSGLTSRRLAKAS